MMKRLMLVLCLFCCLGVSLDAQKKAPKRTLSEVEAELSVARDSLRQAVTRQDSLAALLSQMDTIRTLFAQGLTERYGDYPQGDFASMNPVTMDSLMFLGRRVGEAELDAFLSALDSAACRYQVYQESVSVIENECDTTAINTALSHIEEVLPACSAGQREELSSLADRMGIYRRALSRAKRIAQWVESSLKIYREDEEASEESARGAASFIFTDRDYDYQEYISKIPYLARLFDAYKQAVLASPLQVGPEERQILSYE